VAVLTARGVSCSLERRVAGMNSRCRGEFRRRAGWRLHLTRIGWKARHFQSTAWMGLRAKEGRFRALSSSVRNELDQKDGIQGEDDRGDGPTGDTSAGGAAEGSHDGFAVGEKEEGDERGGQGEAEKHL
jgi:hypothetical protein